MSHKVTTSDYSEDTHKFVLYGISDSMASLVQSSKYGAINTTDASTMGYYVIKFVLQSYTLHDYTTCNGKIISAGELIIKLQYLGCM